MVFQIMDDDNIVIADRRYIHGEEQWTEHAALWYPGRTAD